MFSRRRLGWIMLVSVFALLANECLHSLQAAQAGKRVNSVDGAEMVLIPGGTFQMGSDTGLPDEKPVHEQTVESFWMYTKEVTNGQYAKFVEANPQWAADKVSSDLASGEYLGHWKNANPLAPSGPAHPVSFISWHAARAYAEWAGGRLPTEAEWEYAAKGGKNYEFGTSTGKIGPDLANYNGFRDGVLKVGGTYPANPFGLYDIAGNMSEWCSTRYRPYPYKADDGREDPKASGSRVMRDNTWRGSFDTQYRSTNRSRSIAVACDFQIGLRVVVPENK